MKTRQSTNVRKAIQIVLATGVAVGAAQEASADIFLMITGLPGESVDSKHKDAIDVISYSQYVDNKDCRFTIVKNVDRATPGLANAAATKTAFGSATIVTRKDGKGQSEFYTLTMQNVIVTSAEQSFTSAEAAAEVVVISPKFLTVSYRPQNTDGSLAAPVETTFNCNK